MSSRASTKPARRTPRATSGALETEARRGGARPASEEPEETARRGDEDQGDDADEDQAAIDEVDAEDEPGAGRAFAEGGAPEVDETALAPRAEPPPLTRVEREPVQRFLSEARRFPRLSEDEERALIAAVREQGDREAARRLVVHNLRLVVTIAYQYRQAWTNILDLFQEGSVGLMEAVKRWDPALGTRFGSYAAYWIRAFILRFLMTNARLIHVGNTRAGRKLFFRLEKERQRLLAAGYDPTPKLLAAKLEVDEKDLEEVSAHLASREVSFEPRPGDEGVSLEERISGRTTSPETEAARTELSESVAGLMRRFEDTLTDERERAIWREHLAAPDEPVPLGVLGDRFGVTKQRMGQIADKLKKRFREVVVTELGAQIQLDWQPEVEE